MSPKDFIKAEPKAAPNAQEKADGEAGARRAAAMLSIALCAEVNHGTMAQDWKKIDLLVNFNDPLDKDAPRSFPCQVKTGISYRADSSDKKTLKLKGMGQELIEALVSIPGLIIWVPPKPRRDIYWYVCRRASKKTVLDIPTHQKLSPALRYELARVFAKARSQNRLARHTLPAAATAKDILTDAKHRYRALKAENPTHPYFGQLKVTQLAWRHVTRHSKTSKRRLLALRVLPQLQSALKAFPDSYTLKAVGLSVSGRTTIEQRTYVLWYDNVLNIDGSIHSLMVRVKETVTYPKNWREFPLSVTDVQQSATLLSWWAKPQKK